MIQVDDITVEVGSFRLAGVSFEVPAGSYGMLMGKTGSGKTTLLEVIAGLKTVESGRIRFGERDVTAEPPAARQLGYVPQDGALFSTMTVRQNVSFALDIRKRRKKETADRVAELSRLLHIEPLLDRPIQGLSGGERQRVAIGRALSFRPTVLLLDEPLSALDDSTRAQMYELLKLVQKETHVTILHVTHHWDDVEHLADVVFRVEDGGVSEDEVAANS